MSQPFFSLGRNNLFVVLVAIQCLVFLSSCAMPPKASIKKDAEAKQFVSAKDSSTVYVYRDQYVASLIGIAVTVNGKKVGVTAPRSFFKLNLPSGNYRIASHYDGNLCDIDIDAEKGKTYFIWQELNFSLTNTCSMTLVDDNLGKNSILQLDLLTSIYDK